MQSRTTAVRSARTSRRLRHAGFIVALAWTSVSAVVTPGCGGAIGTDRPLLQESRAAQAGLPSTIVIPKQPADASGGAAAAEPQPATGEVAK